jgi:monofunctional glycosyltransferase
MNGCLKTKMYSYYLCNDSPNYVPIDMVSPHVINAIIVSEDGTFYDHHGFDWFEIKDSLEKNLSTFDYARGGSTITQQLAKNVFLSGEKSLLRKVREAILTMQIEKKFSKRQILEKYLNVVEFGPNIFGVKAAANHYFGKDPASLDILEAAFLAFLLPSPKKYSESFKVKNLTPFARKRLAQIVVRMAKYRKISDDEKVATLERLGGSQWLDTPVVEEDYLTNDEETNTPAYEPEPSPPIEVEESSDDT